MTTPKPSTRFLRWTLIANALFSGFSGIWILATGNITAMLLGPEIPGDLTLVGWSLLFYAIGLFFVSLMRPIPARPVVAAILLDLGWVIGSTVLILAGVFSHTGTWIVAVCAELVFMFALFQFIGLRRHRKVELSMGGLVIAISSAMLLQACHYSDLRTQSLSEEPTLKMQKKGKDLLKETARRSGLETWKTFATKEFTGTDEWAGEDSGWWPGNPQRIRMQTILNSFSSRVELLDGPFYGEIWGIQSWKPFKQKRGERTPQFLNVPDPAIKFYLPTLHYFDELTFRVLAAPLVAYSGESFYQNQAYDRVLVTWGSWSPNPDYDQYDIWINRKTGYIDHVSYTVRDAVKMAKQQSRNLMKVLAVGTIHFRDYRAVQGVHVPFEQIVTLGSLRNAVLPLQEHFFHKLVLDSVEFGRVSEDAIRLDPGIRELGDRKL